MKKRDEITRYMIRWNNKFPVDRWWREKHNVPFMSSEHRGISFLDQLRELKEDLLFLDLKQEREEEKSPYIPNIGDFMKQKIEPISETGIPTDREIEKFNKIMKALKEAEDKAKQESDGDRGQTDTDSSRCLPD